MPVQIKVVYWNVQNFGDNTSRRGNYVPLCNFIAEVMANLNADILCLMEARFNQLSGHIAVGRLLLSLTNASMAPDGGGGWVQTCDWHCDRVPPAIIYNGAFAFPYSPNVVGFTDQARQEGYLVFWKQNLAKFVMQRADQIDLANATPPNHVPGAGWIANTQSRGILTIDAAGQVNSYGADLNIPLGLGGQYTLPTGTIVGPGGIATGGIVIPPGPTGGPNLLNPGDIIPVGTQFGVHGLRLNNAAIPVAFNPPILIPGNYTVTTALTLPNAGDTIVPNHVLSLVVTRRQMNAGNPVAPYNPFAGPGGNLWELADFPATDGANLWNGSRRPAYCTIKTNIPGAPLPNQLTPIIFYHAPLSAPAYAMQSCAMSQPLYEAQGPGPAYIHNNRAIVGGDFNERLNPLAFHYWLYTEPYPNWGADCRFGVTQNIRVNQPAPFPPPVFPPPSVPPTVADNPENKSSVQLLHPIIGGLPVISNNVQHYRRGAIDNIFYRGFTPLQAPRNLFLATPFGGPQVRWEADLYDLVRAVRRIIPPWAGPPPGGVPDNFGFPPWVIQAFLALPVFVNWLFGAPPPAALNDSIIPAQLWNDINLGTFQTPFGGDPVAPPGIYPGPPLPPPLTVTPERRAAEFIKMFVSDHLPVIFQMDV